MPVSINTNGVILQGIITPTVLETRTAAGHIAGMDSATILKRLISKGFSQEEIAVRVGTTQQSISRWLNKDRKPSGPAQALIREMAMEHDILEGPVETPKGMVPVMGLIGAGAEISPEFEQVPPDGLDQIDLPFDVPEGVIGFRVVGDSMWPRYDDGDVVLVHREQQSGTPSLVGQEAAVRTREGRRYLKRLMRGPKSNSFNLESFNARTIEGARIAWASPIWIVIKASQIRRMTKQRA